MNGEQTIIRGYYALPAMIERKIVIDFYKFGQLSERSCHGLQNHLRGFDFPTALNMDACNGSSGEWQDLYFSKTAENVGSNPTASTKCSFNKDFSTRTFIIKSL